MKRKTVCIVCQKEKKGLRVEDDPVIDTIRKIKEKLHASTGNTLVVCKECLPKAEEKRRRFERTAMTWGVLAVLMAVLLLLISFSIQSLLLAIVMGVVFMLLALVSYYPKVEKHGKET
ncbi:MAG: hypothetical protein QXF56_04320 [Candidatus Micrarchaeia archaeon]